MMSKTPAINTTKTVTVLLAVNFVVYLLLSFHVFDAAQQYLLLLAFNPGLLLNIAHVEPPSARLLIAASPLAYSFLHYQFIHLAMNMLFILAFATRIEQLVGPLRMLLFYGLTAICGALGVAISYLIDPVNSMTIGASGAASGLFGGFIRTALPRPWLLGGIFILLNIAFGFSGVLIAGEVRAVAWEAHIGGLVAGMVFFPYFLPKTGTKVKK